MCYSYNHGYMFDENESKNVLSKTKTNHNSENKTATAAP